MIKSKSTMVSINKSSNGAINLLKGNDNRNNIARKLKEASVELEKVRNNILAQKRDQFEQLVQSVQKTKQAPNQANIRQLEQLNLKIETLLKLDAKDGVSQVINPLISSPVAFRNTPFAQVQLSQAYPQKQSALQPARTERVTINNFGSGDVHIVHGNNNRLKISNSLEKIEKILEKEHVNVPESKKAAFDFLNKAVSEAKKAPTDDNISKLKSLKLDAENLSDSFGLAKDIAKIVTSFIPFVL